MYLIRESIASQSVALSHTQSHSVAISRIQSHSDAIVGARAARGGTIPLRFRQGTIPLRFRQGTIPLRFRQGTIPKGSISSIKVQSLCDAHRRMGTEPERRRACLEQLHRIEAERPCSGLFCFVKLRELRGGRFSHELAAHCSDAAVEDARATPVHLWGGGRRAEHVHARRRESDASAPPATESWALPVPPPPPPPPP